MLDCRGNSRTWILVCRSFNQSPIRSLEHRHFLRDSLGIFEHFASKDRREIAVYRQRRPVRARFIGNPRNAPSFRRVPQAPGKPEEISIVSRSLALPSLLFPNIVARVPRSRSIAECINPGWVKGFVRAPPARGANRYAAPFPPAVLRSARWRCSCSCGRSCGSSVDDAFCGRSGRYAVMRIVAGTPPPSFLPPLCDKYLTGFTMPREAHRKYRRYLFINASRCRRTFAWTEYRSFRHRAV